MFSIIMPMDTNRLEQFKNTKLKYDSFPQEKEFIIPTREIFAVEAYIRSNKLDKDIKLVGYVHDEGYNPSKALNIGVRNAKYDQVIVTSPEVLPISDVLPQLEELIGQNVICQVTDEAENGTLTILVSTGFRNTSPAYYFLAMFNKKDIESINGWDEEFMKGYAYEDNDFGERWNRAGLPFIIKDEILAKHQYHPRSETIPNGVNINSAKFQDNNNKGIVWVENGLVPSVPTP